MKAINLFTYTRIQNDYASQYAHLLAQRKEKEKIRPYEFDDVKLLVEEMEACGLDIEEFDGFFYSFYIRQIGKEFDLLKINRDHMVLNIELKSNMIEESKIEKQLKQNRFYLKHLADDIRSFTFIGESRLIYQYTEQGLEQVDRKVLAEAMKQIGTGVQDEIETLFEAKSYLISPLNTPDEFLKGYYFLTNQQRDFKEKILTQIGEWEQTDTQTGPVIGITGKAGSGKTLLLYDLAKTMAKQGKNCCVIHSGKLCDGHEFLNQFWENVDIIPAKELTEEHQEVLEKCELILVDEAQRLYRDAVDKILYYGKKQRCPVIFSYDPMQTLSRKEEKNDIAGKLNAMECFAEYKMSDRIRTCREIASFYTTLLNLNEKAKNFTDYSDVEVLYARNQKEAFKLIDFYREKEGYIFISYTPSFYSEDELTLYAESGDYVTHDVVGQEFDKVLLVMDENFHYSPDGYIQAGRHPNPDYRFYKLLYQGVSRTREKLCILVVGNYPLFEQVADIKYTMLSRYLYRESDDMNRISAKQINKLTKQIRELGKELKEEDGVALDDAAVTLAEELMKREPQERLLRLCVSVMKRIMQEYSQKEKIRETIRECIEYIEKNR